jgi:hypothetical protein
LNTKNTSKKILFTVVICTLISIFVISYMLFLNFETSMTLPETSATMSDYIESLSTSHLIQHPTKNPYFDYYFTENDILRMQNNLDWIDGVRIMLNNSSSEQLIEELKPTGNSVVIFPIFTSIAYQNPGFYTYYAGNCLLNYLYLITPQVE